MRAPLMLVATGEPFEYPHPDWGESVVLIGPCEFDPPAADPQCLNDIEQPIVLVTTSSDRQADSQLPISAMAAFVDQPVHVVATYPSGVPDGITVPDNATVQKFVPHGLVLDRAVCAVTHGGMGTTQKALARGVPVCVVPHGRDQFEVARRVEVSRSGTRLPAKKLTAAKLKSKVLQAMPMTAGAHRVAAGFQSTGGVAHGSDMIERRLIGVQRRNLRRPRGEPGAHALRCRARGSGHHHRGAERRRRDREHRPDGTSVVLAAER